MKNIITSVTLRAGIATALCIAFVIYLPLRVSSAAAAHVAIELKTESQYRSEATRYGGAIRAIAGIATMKLETRDDLKNARAILDRERPNLKFHRSKFVVMAISDSTFADAVKKMGSDKRAAEAFAKEGAADSRVVLKLDGAESLRTRIRRSAEADAAILRRAGERLKEAAQKIRQVSQGAATGFGATGEFKVIQAGFSEASQPNAALETPAMSAQDPLTIIAILWIAFIVLLPTVSIIVILARYAGEEEDIDQVAECQETADNRYLSCVSEANDLPPLVSDVAKAACYGDWLINQAGCLTLYV